MSRDDFISILLPFQYVSFDLFDTLMFRTVSQPAMIFDIAEEWYRIRFDKQINQFRLKREYAENEARNLSNKEITIEDIYKRISLSSIDRKRMMEIECECESSNCIANPIMVDIANKCYQAGKTIIITTDMYLPHETIYRILSKIGVSFHHLFISGEEGVTKQSGKLFPVILNKLNIKADDLIHIGDDDNNDIAQPEKIGIKAAKRLVSFMPNHPAQTIGYNILGPFMASFCLWLHRVKEEEKLNKLYFVAREGYFMKVAYETLFPEEKHLCEYIHLNKNILRLPSLYGEQPFKTFLSMLPPRKDYSWMELFLFLHIKNIEQLCSHIKKHVGSFDENKKFSGANLSEEHHQEIFKLVIEFLNSDIEEQRGLLIQYLKNKKLFSYQVGLINNSLNGNGQSILEKILSHEKISYHIKGIQVSATQACRTTLGKRMRDFFSENTRHPYASNIFIDHALIIEHLLFENAGTALYLKKGEDAKPIVICDEIGVEEKNIVFKEEIQRFAIQYLQNTPIDIQKNIAAKAISNLCSFLSFPSKAEASFIRQFYDVDIDGNNHLINEKPFSKRYIYFKDKPPYARWIEGYLVLHDVSSMEMRLFLLRRILLNTLSNNSNILAFLTYIVSASFYKLTNLSSYLFYKSYCFIKLRIIIIKKLVQHDEHTH